MSKKATKSCDEKHRVEFKRDTRKAPNGIPKFRSAFVFQFSLFALVMMTSAIRCVGSSSKEKTEDSVQIKRTPGAFPENV